ncbi:MAG TPA: alpha/beta fold hydrolase [Terracidiphilus sp.]|jgi:pimeloyl-ACP methyl ester carboxylesterase|nr:alpha/beta fold hydrolase [Terracidiphilus sp.]
MLLRLLLFAMCLLIAISAAFWFRPLAVFFTYSDLRLLAAGARSHSVTVSQIHMHYYVLGPEDGPPVVLVHGLGSRAEDWRNLAPALAKAGHRVYLPDLPGFGRSEQPAGFSYSIPDQADVVVGFLDAMGLRRVELGGWSMGGWIVQRVAAAHPERVSKLVLFDSAGIYEVPRWNILLFTPVNENELAQLDALLMPHPPTVPSFVARDILRLSDRNAWVIHRALGSMLTGHDTTDSLLPTLKMPVLLEWGSEDHITPLDQGEKMQNLIPHSQLVVIKGCGHLAPDQCAERMTPSVLDFLKN